MDQDNNFKKNKTNFLDSLFKIIFKNIFNLDFIFCVVLKEFFKIKFFRDDDLVFLINESFTKL